MGGAETLLVNSLAPGGLQEHADNILVYFQGTSALESRIDERVKIVCLNYTGLTSLPRVLRQIRQLIKEQQADIVHSHLNPAGFYTHLACPAAIPQVHTLHTTYSMDAETPRFKLFLEKHFYFMRKSCNIILLSDFTQDDFLKAVPFSGRSFVLNNFVPDRFFDNTSAPYNASDKNLKLLAAGTLKELKNFEYLLDVFSYLKDEPVSLDIYGGGDKSKYEEIIQRNGLNVRMMGQIDDLAAVLPGYHLFIMPSKFEGFPLTVFEAMASGLPLLLSDIPPLRSIVKEHAIYFDLQNAEKLADQIRSILHQQLSVAEMAISAKSYAAETVKREIYISKLLDIYGQLKP